MRTLLVDNYDSFTYNLFHLLAEVNGREPEVVRNDAPHWTAGRLTAFDNVVISPGPGHPGRAADFGICTRIIDESDLPLLGICLGHQGIGLSGGATVSRAPKPRHGLPSPVLHDGTGLFDSLPSPFEVVRYHSLAVTDLPEELEPTAWTPDGVLMGLRHRTRPQWGLQFHPESVCSTYGAGLLRNFARLTREHRRATAGTVRTAGPASGRTAAAVARTGQDTAERAPASTERIRSLRVLSRTTPARCEAETAYDLLFRGNDHAYWLDSSQYGHGRGRFSMMGDATGPLARVAVADVWSGTVTVTPAHGTAEIVAGPFLEWLDRDLRGISTRLPDTPCDFALGWVGFLGYELKAECGGDFVHRSDEPDAVMVFADRALVFDHVERVVHLLALVEGADETAALTWLDATGRRLERAAGRVLPGPRPPERQAAVTLRHDRDDYLGLIDDCLDQIAHGETYEVCLTNQAVISGSYDPWETYRVLRRVSPAPFAALLQFGGVNVLSTSPERFLRVDPTGLAESSPIKGTRPRGDTPEADAALVADLVSDQKDRAENLMIVDLVRNDLGRCAVPGSVEANDIFRVESYATVHQLVSTVRARLRPELTALDCVRAAFPGGSMTGAPKIRTMRAIDRLEGGPRGVYSGAVGYFSLSGAADLSIVIRTAVVTPDRITYGVGGAVVALSDPAAEFEETAVKAAPLLALARTEFPQRTQRRVQA
ncbi:MULTISPECIES: aminodeoxychorismate synthase component I [unclassified Streptomyces]|uniref:aminodeoxychorismate synthase component I n=1 Tax=unclassified Streptomyces TaxID=2593676 RepID=UPI000DAE5303|nr:MULTISPECIES: aminodeoxychorismate synthase component I [unclassified Streptomyces]PZT74827.1 aminodeoxychorismate synthase component I [Streptomyces sp. AC1-42T]PZT82188.1 aminodeoxychorismate synthase component I [Streptomyces sp. AC1-42W]